MISFSRLVVVFAVCWCGIARESGAASITNFTSGDWSSTGTWIGGVVPNDNDDVVIRTGTVVLTNETKQLTSLTITNSTLSFSNWTTRVRATTVTLLNSATVTVTSAFTTNAMSNRVWIACTDLTIASNASINVDGKGWAGADGSISAAGHGPGAGLIYKASAGYGGSGGRQEGAGITGAQPWGSLPYGSASDPSDPGSGGSASAAAGRYGGAGGGAVRIEAGGLMTVNGRISANGANGGNFGLAGSGGGIYIFCNAIQGAGIVRADGGDKADNPYSSGGGGRIAVHYNAGAQAALDVPTIVFSAGRPNNSGSPGEIGTLYFTDSRFLARNPLTGITGQWHSAAAVIGLSSLTVSNSWIRFVSDGLNMTVTNELLLCNNARLEIGGNAINPELWWDYQGSTYWEVLARPMTEMTANPRLHCGSLTITNGGTLRVFAGMTNSSVTTGALVNVTGTLSIATNSWVYPVSHLTNGGSVLFSLGGLAIQQGGGFNADGLGFGNPRNTVKTNGFGPGGGRYNSSGYGNYQGGGYGGFGGGYTNTLLFGITNGSANLPLSPGSAGGAAAVITQTRAGSGGGLVWIEAPSATLTIDGTISANGGALRAVANFQSGGAGSGGGIFIRSRGLTGAATGQIRANGGDVIPADATRPGGTGGGGRIAFWVDASQYSYLGSTNVTPGTGGGSTGTVGSIRMLADPNVPAINNAAPAGFDAGSADMVGYLSSTGAFPTTVFCFWGTNDGAMVKANWMTNSNLAVRDVGYHTNSVSGLSPTTRYHYRFYASNSWGDAWAPSSTNFTTTGGFVVNNGGGATAITPSSARLRGEVIASPSPAVYVCWGTNNVVSDSTGLWERVESVGTLSGEFQWDLAGLLANQTYYYRCYATNTSEGLGAWASMSTNFPTASPDLSIADASVTEGGDGETPTLAFAVTLSATSATPVSVDYATSNGTATAGEDFSFASGTLTIPSGIVSTSIAVTVTGDTADEFPSETFYVVQSNAVAANITDNLATGTITDDDDEAEVKTWTGNGVWTSNTNWSPAGYPSPSDTVVLQSGSVLLSSPQAAASVVVSNGATLTFTNWSTKLTVAGEMTIRSNATVTLPAAFTNGAMSNRVWIGCATLAIHAGGKIDVDGKGFAGGRAEYGVTNGFGPGAGMEAKSAGGYGGAGGRQEPTLASGSLPYGAVSAPEVPGSGGGSALGGGSYGGAGGGAVRIEASGGVTVDGTITANGSGVVFGGGAGSGGGIYITCSTIAGTGVVRANGAYGGAGGGGILTRSGGGRVAVVYDTGAQASIDVPSLVLSAGTPGNGSPDSAPGDLGTLYFPDNRLLQRTPLTGLTGQWHSASATFGFSQLTVSNVWLRLVNDRIHLDVANHLLLESGARLEIGGNTIQPDVWWDRLSVSYRDILPRPMSEMTVNPRLTCGSLTVTNGGALWVYAGLTNASLATGAAVTVNGMLSVASNAWIYPVSHATNGGSVIFSAGSMNIDAGGGFNADALGYACKANWNHAGGYGPGGGYQWISGQTAIGGGHGGAGGNAKTNYLGQPYGQPYGSSNVPPFYCGSGGGASAPPTTYRGGSGGGLLWIDVINGATINGTLSANGGNARGVPSMAQSGGGSGGGIWLTCRRLSGNGTMRANGGSAEFTSGSGTGGGGRIAIFRTPSLDTFTGSGTYLYTAGTNGTTTGAAGTFAFGAPPPARGTVMLIH
jgi:hypothetical protein